MATTLTTLDDTRALASELVREFVPWVKEKPLVIGITGPLGAGKTTLTQALAAELDIAEDVTSPTYTYLEEYPFVAPGVKGMLHHLDAWRVDDISVFEQLRIGELVAAGNIVVVEWYDQVAEWMELVLQERGARLVKVQLTEKNGKRTAELEVCDYESEG